MPRSFVGVVRDLDVGGNLRRMGFGKKKVFVIAREGVDGNEATVGTRAVVGSRVVKIHDGERQLKENCERLFFRRTKQFMFFLKQNWMQMCQAINGRRRKIKKRARGRVRKKV